MNPAPEDSLKEDIKQHSDELINGNHFTWRGTAGIDVKEAGLFYGKGMRIDYAMVSKSLVEREGFVIGLEICGHGKDRSGFLGSDHSPIILRLKHC